VHGRQRLELRRGDRVRYPLAALVLLAACSEASAPRDQRPQTDAATLAPDAAPPQDAAPQAFVDAAPQALVDAAPQDAAVQATDTAAPPPSVDAVVEPEDAAPRPLRAAQWWPADALEWVGEPPVRVDLNGQTAARLSPAHRLRLRLEPGAEDAPAALVVEAALWRREEGRVRVRVDAGPWREGLVLGEGDAPRRLVRQTDAETAGVGLTHVPPPLPLDLRGASTLEVEVIEAGAAVLGVGLVDARATDVETTTGDSPTWPPGASSNGDAVTELALAPCLEADCDDGAALTRAVADAPETPLRVRLLAGRFRLRTPVVVARSNVHVEAAPDATLVWDPADASAGAAMVVRGRGPIAPEVEVVGDVSAFAWSLPLSAPLAAASPWVRLVSDDHLDVPRVCVNGRDVERFQRHTQHIARALLTPNDAPTPSVELDRGIGVNLPAAARPRVAPLELLTGIRLTGLTLEALCPRAWAEPLTRTPTCDNPGVVDDDGIALTWTAGAVVEGAALRGFGAFSVSVRDAFETRVVGLKMDHPSNYGEGGRGYGLHAITAARTLVRGADVHTARHALVIDFGSSDTQLIGGLLRDTTLAPIDVHGEASRDTLIRGNDVRGGQTGILIGGGGLEVHCNDGPRHHVELNTVRGAGASFGVANATRNVTFRGNDVADALTHLTVAFESGEVLAVGNRFGPSSGTPVLVTSGSGPVMIERNVFEAACSEATAVVNAGGVGVVARENAYCPAPIGE